jgi:succinate-semialdehyde dehydrogenase/glutarate-semialdehyde dehydrogenase
MDLKEPSLFVQKALIGADWVESAFGREIEVENPATGEIIGSVPDCGREETEAAIGAAKAAFAAWRLTSAETRGQLLRKWYDLVFAHQDDLAHLMTSEQGKPLAEARAEVLYGASFIDWYAEEARRIYGGIVPAPSADRRILLLKEPVGVVAAITPWNFPIAMITRKCAPALAAGCTVVVKPSELTPYSALALAALAERAGIPPGVINVVTGAPDAIGDALIESDDVRKISFTGSTRVGAMLMGRGAATIKRLSLELGGNAPFIVFEDADLDIAVDAAVASKFRNAGQTCVCANRLLVHEAIYDDFADRLASRVIRMRVGPGIESGVEIGPMITVAAAEKTRSYLSDALGKGATNLTPRDSVPAGGRFVSPAVLRDAKASMLVATEEIFGPVAPLFRFSSEAEAIGLANGTPFGLAAYFFTGSMDRAWRVGEALEFGMVGLNTGAISMAVAPFGGVKRSGFGREGGHEGIEEYLETKAFHIAAASLAPIKSVDIA